MSALEVTETRFRNGVWEAIVKGSGDRPDLQVRHQDRPVETYDLTQNDAGAWVLRIPIPQDTIAEGVQTFLICDSSGETRLADFTLIAGEAVADDLRAEVELLRAELDMLKRAFRRHCVETAAS